MGSSRCGAAARTLVAAVAHAVDYHSIGQQPGGVPAAQGMPISAFPRPCLPLPPAHQHPEPQACGSSGEQQRRRQRMRRQTRRLWQQRGGEAGRRKKLQGREGVTEAGGGGDEGRTSMKPCPLRPRTR